MCPICKGLSNPQSCLQFPERRPSAHSLCSRRTTNTHLQLCGGLTHLLRSRTTQKKCLHYEVTRIRTLPLWKLKMVKLTSRCEEHFLGVKWIKESTLQKTDSQCLDRLGGQTACSMQIQATHNFVPQEQPFSLCPHHHLPPCMSQSEGAAGTPSVSLFVG